MTNYMGSDIYCDLIVPKKIEVKIIKETNNVLAFYHTKPHWPMHIVVIPKRHVDSLITLDLNSSVCNELLSLVQEMAAMVTQEHGSCRVLTNLGEYQDSRHLHLHVSSGSPLSKV